MTTNLPIHLNDKSLFQTRSYLDGQWVSADDGAVFAVDNPANGQIIAQVSNLGAAETARAIEAARTALKGWRPRPAPRSCANGSTWCWKTPKTSPNS